MRERLLITLALLFVTWAVWKFAVDGYIDQSRARYEHEIDALYAQLETEVARQSQLSAAKLNDPNVRLGRERTVLDEQRELLDVELDSVVGRFVPPERMPVLLGDVIRHHEGLKLKRMVSLPVETVRLGSAEESGDTGEAYAIRAVYKHPLRLEFVGDYFEVFAYLTELEASDWEFGWRRLDYTVTEHPAADVTIEIETLSLEKSWIGV